MVSKKQRAKSSETAAKILDAADELLVEVGYDGISTRAVAERAGVNKALVFYYFGSKADLVDRVLERYYEAHLTWLESAFDASLPPRERFSKAIDRYLDFIEANRRYPRLVQQQLASGEAHGLIEDNLAALYERTAAALDDIAPKAGPQAARHLFVTLSGLVINYFIQAPALGDKWGSDPLSPDGLAERRAHVHWMVDLILDGLVRAS